MVKNQREIDEMYSKLESAKDFQRRFPSIDFSYTIEHMHKQLDALLSEAKFNSTSNPPYETHSTGDIGCSYPTNIQTQIEGIEVGITTLSGAIEKLEKKLSPILPVDYFSGPPKGNNPICSHVNASPLSMRIGELNAKIIELTGLVEILTSSVYL